MKLWNALPVIDDDFPVTHHEFGTGYSGRDYSEYPLNGQSFNRAPSVARLTEQEIVELVIEKIAKRSFIVDICDAAGLKPKNQKQSSYCWIHGPTGAMDMQRVFAGHTHPIIYHSAFYAGSQIKHGANQGGSGVQGVKWLVEHGTCREDLWPPMQFKGTVTDEIKADAAKRQITICEEFEPGDHLGINSSIVQDQPITVGVPALVARSFGVRSRVQGRQAEGRPTATFAASSAILGGDWGDKGMRRARRLKGSSR
jgi:hypothetical protein